MKNFFILFLLVNFTFYAQEKINYLSPDELTLQLQQHQEDGELEKLVELLSTVHPSDTAYCSRLTTKSYYLLNLKKFEEALQVTKEGLSLDCDKKSKMYFYVNTGYAYNQMKKYQEAIDLYNEALKEFPKSANIWYNQGVVYQEMGEVEKAFQNFKQAIQYHPTHANSHYNLGHILYTQGETTLGFLAQLTSIFVEPDEESSLRRLGALNEKMSVKNPHNKTALQLDADQGSFQQLDLLLDNLIALEKRYKVDHKIDIALIKQLHLLLDQLDNNAGNGGFWSKTYLPLFQWVKENNQFETFANLLLMSTTNEAYQKYLKKETNTVIEFAKTAFPQWYEYFLNTNTELAPKDGLVPNYSYEEGYISGIGYVNDEVATGDWVFYSPTGYKISEGKFDEKGDRIGVWKFYDDFGKLEEENSYTVDDPTTIAITTFFPHGKKQYEYSLKGDNPHGNYKSYTYYGALKQEKNFEEGQLQGDYEAYFDTGKSHIEFKTNYVDDEINGDLIEYYANGEVYSIIPYEKGIQQGKEQRFGRSGNISFNVEVINDQAQGEYTTYYDNGQVYEKGYFENGTPTGVWETFDSDGNLASQFNYNANGELDGQYIVYEDTQKQTEYTYKNGEIIAYACYDKNGVEIINEKKKKGKFYFKGYTLDGSITNEGEYDSKGGKTGIWIDYYNTGVISEKGEYKENKPFGEFDYYHSNGKLAKTISYNEEGLKHGYARFYYPHGQLKSQGWYQNDAEEGVWENYYQDGSLQVTSFFLQGKYQGERKFYSVGGQLDVVEKYNDGNLIYIAYYDQNEEVYDQLSFVQNEEKYTLTYKGISFEKEVESEYLNGIRNGSYTRYDIDGNIILQGNYLVGMQHGDWKWYNEGKLVTEATYQYNDLHGKLVRYNEEGETDYVEYYNNGQKTGEWTSYHDNGKISIIEHYKNDKLHGKKSLFNPSGLLQIYLFYDQDRLVGYSYLDANQKETAQIAIENQTADIVAYYPNGNISQQFSIKNGLFEGEYLVFFENGKLRYQQNFLNGELHGPKESFFANGSVQRKFAYSYNELHGVYQIYHENGQLKSEKNYVFDALHGEANYFSKSGKLTKKEKYFNDDLYEKETF